MKKRSGNTSAETLGRLGNMQVRLVSDEKELDAALALRFDVFNREFGACAYNSVAATDRDRDAFDDVCDHLVVLDDRIHGETSNRIVGTYRLLPHDRAMKSGFYSAQEFTINDLVERYPTRRLLELGRSCVLPAYRGRRTIELLWQGIWAYCRRQDIDIMVGCASFPGVNAMQFAQGLSFLHHFAGSPDEWDVKAVGKHAFSTDLMPAEAIHHRQALAELPPLVKGYLRLGATYARSAVVDPAFRSVDVFVTLPVEKIDRRYLKHYGENAERFAA